jgi:sulfite reductase (NADPH) hemoprotein beta-component
MPDVVGALIDTYIDNRHEDERFIDTVRRLGIEPFKTRVYAGRAERKKERKASHV